MIIDYKKIDVQNIEGFKGGKGLMSMRCFDDGKDKIMLSRLAPGANIGFHSHEMNSEVIYCLSGEGHFEYDDTVEAFHTGDVHYCPMGHAHAMFNDGETDLVYFAIVAEHH